jgi:predicted permease
MNSIAIKLAPVLSIFFLGIILKKAHILSEENADSFQKLVFYVAFPASLLLSVPKMELSLTELSLPFYAIGIILITFLLARIVARFFNFNKPTLGTFLVGSIIINTGFTYPFVLAAYGQEGFAIVSFFDFGNALMLITFTYYVAIKHGDNGDSGGLAVILKKLGSSTPLWALAIAIIMNVAKINIPGILTDTLTTLGNMIVPLFMLSLGIYFKPKMFKFKAAIAVILLRMFLGLLLGFVVVYLFKLEGLYRIIVLICSAAPVGFNTLTLSTLENLDKEFAACIVSNSILIGIILTTFLMFVL